jgi:hypothetical protein
MSKDFLRRIVNWKVVSVLLCPRQDDEGYISLTQNERIEGTSWRTGLTIIISWISCSRRRALSLCCSQVLSPVIKGEEASPVDSLSLSLYRIVEDACKLLPDSYPRVTHFAPKVMLREHPSCVASVRLNSRLVLRNEAERFLFSFFVVLNTDFFTCPFYLWSSFGVFGVEMSLTFIPLRWLEHQVIAC